MANSALQLLGFIICLIGVAATIASVLMVEWTKKGYGTERNYDGLWMSCEQVGEQMTCKTYQSVLKLSTEIQATRAGMMVSLFLSAVAIVIASVGMKCTHFMDSVPDTKSKTALSGGIIFIISGLLSIIITSWYVQMVIINFNKSKGQQSKEFGHAVFVSWIGGFLTLIGGIFLSCMRCCRNRSTNSINPNQLHPVTKHKSDYV